jgi:arginyl-tRNA synthetase
MNVLSHLQQLLHQALTGLVADPAPYAVMLKPAQDPRFGDYQANCAMSLAKVLGKPAREVAQTIVQRLDLGDVLEQPEVAGPGFINLRLRTDWLARQLRTMASDDRLRVEPVSSPRTFVIDYSSPNVAKPMHVGHLRSTIIGDALARLLRFLGHKVIADNHLGDWGTQFGMILWGWKNHRDEKAYKTDPVGELARLYRLAQSKIKPLERHESNLAKVQKLEAEGKHSEGVALFDKLFCETGTGLTRQQVEALVEEGQVVDKAARQETARLHAGDPENRALWQGFMPHCLGALQEMYDRLDIHFDVQLGESAYDSMLPGVVADLQARGLAVLSEGAICVFVEGFENPVIVRKSDGAFNYSTSDLATIKYRKEHFNPDVLLYVVDHRQGGHFQPMFAAARRWGYDDIVLEHVAFGTVMGRDGKPYKTSEGDVVGLESLLDAAVARARTVYETTRREAEERGEDVPEIEAMELARIYEVVGIGAVKYADLSQNRTSDYVYDEVKMMAMDGNTATYMQYAYARNRSIFRRGNVDPATLRRDPPAVQLATPQERDLAVQLIRFHDALTAAAAEYKPNLITGYLWDLAKNYSGFFQNCPVLKAETPELRQSRLLLCDLTARVIQCGLGLLGIRTLERM